MLTIIYQIQVVSFSIISIKKKLLIIILILIYIKLSLISNGKIPCKATSASEGSWMSSSYTGNIWYYLLESDNLYGTIF